MGRKPSRSSQETHPPRPRGSGAGDPAHLLPALNKDAGLLVSTRDLLVLRILAEYPQHGAEIDRALYRICRPERLQHTAVYSTLRRLSSEGYVKAVARRDRDTPGNARLYAITRRGRGVLMSYTALLGLPLA